MFKKIKINQVKKFFQKSIELLSEEVFLFFLIFVFLVIISSFLFFSFFEKYLSSLKEKPQYEESLTIEERNIQEILDILKSREKNFEEIDFSKKISIF